MTLVNPTLGQRAVASLAALCASWMLVSAAVGPMLPIA